MMRWIPIALAASIGLNAGLLWMHFAPGAPDHPPPPNHRSPRGDMGGPGPGRGVPPEGIPEDWLDRRLEHLTDRLELEEDQREQFRAILEEHIGLLGEKREQAMVTREKVHDQLLAGDVDEAEAARLASTLSRVQTELDSLVVQTLIRELRLLTPEQREAYINFMPWGGGGPHDRGPGGGMRGKGRRGP